MEDNCRTCQTEHTYRLDKLDEQVTKLTECSNNLKLKTEKIDESNKSAHLRLNEMKEQTNAILRLGIAVEQMTAEIKEILIDHKEHEKRLTILEKAPGEEAYDREKQVKNYILIAIVGAVLGAIFMKLGVKL